MAERTDKRTDKGMNVKIADEELKGRYANLVRITHTREEFILDFINMVPPQGAVTARVITSPGHLTRLIGALQAISSFMRRASARSKRLPSHQVTAQSIDPLWIELIYG